MLKILVVSDFRHLHTARPEAEIFIGLQHRGHQVSIVTDPSAKYVDRFKSEGLEVIELPSQNVGTSAAINTLHRLIQSQSYDIVHAASRKTLKLVVAACKDSRVKVVGYKGYAGNASWLNPGNYSNYLNRRVDAVICNAQPVADVLCRQPIFRCNKARVIHKGHDPTWYDDVQPAQRTTMGIGDHTFLVCTCANARSFKGIRYLIQAVHMLAPDLDIHFLLIGAGMDSRKHRAMLQGTSFERKVTFAGYVENPLPLVAMANLFVLPSLRGESLTKAVVEAMCLEVPAVITDIPGNKKLVIEGVNGTIVPTRNPGAIAKAIQTLALDPQRCAKMGAEARRHIDNSLHHNTTVDQVERLYLELARDVS